MDTQEVEGSLSLLTGISLVSLKTDMLGPVPREPVGWGVRSYRKQP